MAVDWVGGLIDYCGTRARDVLIADEHFEPFGVVIDGAGAPHAILEGRTSDVPMILAELRTVFSGGLVRGAALVECGHEAEDDERCDGWVHIHCETHADAWHIRLPFTRLRRGMFMKRRDVEIGDARIEKGTAFIG